MIDQGIAISPGVAVAPVCRYIPAQRTVTQQRAEDAAQELQAYEAALAAAAAALETAYETMKAASGENAAIFEAHLEILRDIAMDEPAPVARTQLCSLLRHVPNSGDANAETGYADRLSVFGQ